MKIIETRLAPNPRRVRIFLAEKGDRGSLRGARSDEGRPEDARLHASSTACSACRCWSSTTAPPSPRPWPSAATSRRLQPEPALFGTGALGRAIVEMWNRRMELGLFFAVAQAFRHLHPAMAQLEVPQVAGLGRGQQGQGAGDRWRSWMRAGHATLHRRRRTSRSPTSPPWSPSTSCGRPASSAPPRLKNLARWHDEVSARPSAKA